MGYVPELKRNFSVWTLLGIGFALTNSWFGISASLVTGISSGGPIVTVYGIAWVAFINGCVGVTLSELASAMPNSGGQYYWAHELAPKEWANFLAYLTGAIGWAGSVFTCSSVALAIGSGLMGMIQINNPDLCVSRPIVTVECSNCMLKLVCYTQLLWMPRQYGNQKLIYCNSGSLRGGWYS